MIELGNPDHIEKIERACGHVFNYRADVCISRSHRGKLLGGVIYEGFTRASIQAHVAGFAPFWLDRTFLWMMFDYPFNQLKVGRVFCQIKETNFVALEFNAKLGFKEVTRIDGVFPEGACVLTELTRDDCRWLNLKPRMPNERQERRT